ncbi:ABC transporter ATP-binding protein [Modestobacter versicolor]|uniref:ABC-type sugar transport system ATPase subunit n=1 Tax=Modestobacter versicolor TaxID=429133 RepID=A0A323VB76_9ACTN|nr:ABC transporter ATP-binding protein [Modestobacter versicolor]MBB3675907.1 ABC-type sugar transport system ATPase subunit [Modestobacter versicolor]PZA20466.1 sugar ABC transporter ATP-binding protein [Modestobacter versicolor]
MASVTFEAVTRSFAQAERPAVDRLDLEVSDGEFLVVVGPSGCGKSTSLRMLAGLEPIDSGRVLIDGQDVTGRRARDRDVAMVFQSYALYPNMTAGENMAFALKNLGVGADEIRTRVAEAARVLQLEELLDRKPAKMSGGQRQRVAMGRAIVRDPKVFCMDEPLSNLDAKLRVSTRAEIASLQKRLGTTTVYVTHDQTEAMTMGDRVVVLRDGQLQQVGTPIDLYERPVNTFVAGFIGSPAINLVTGVPVRDGRAVLMESLQVPLPATGAARALDRVTVGIRPEGADTVGAAGSTGDDRLTVRVARVERLGSEVFAYVDPVGLVDGAVGTAEHMVFRLDKRQDLQDGAVLQLRVQLPEVLVFDADGHALR